MPFGFFRKTKKREDTNIASRKPVGRFRVEKSLKVFSRQVLIGEVIEGLIYPGYKVKGKSVSPIMKIERDHRRVDFAVAGDRVALMLEYEVPCEEGEELEIYQS
ncbi:translation factor [Thermococcus sp. M36]|uniref:tRNA-binding protein Pbp11 n=1 Tax=Thermococcus sp. M36 TaxID=1638261 RepID=UPI00143C8C56|nr:tRNA-binding protein Pbp11 [Thermococcus sp. M36]NJE05918.1 translation factor [Thermococcus sp. M36]